MNIVLLILSISAIVLILFELKQPAQNLKILAKASTLKKMKWSVFIIFACILLHVFLLLDLAFSRGEVYSVLGFEITNRSIFALFCLSGILLFGFYLARAIKVIKLKMALER
jgi:hypothetical protein